MAISPHEPDIAALALSELRTENSGAGWHSPESSDPVLHTDGTSPYTDLVSIFRRTVPSMEQLVAEELFHFVNDLRETRLSEDTIEATAEAETTTESLLTVMVDGKMVELECTICKELFLPDDESVKRLPCSHDYHATCIFKWLKTGNYTCPICRSKVPNFKSSRAPQENQIISGDDDHHHTHPPSPMATQLSEHKPSGSNSFQDLSDAHPIGGDPDVGQRLAEFANPNHQLDVAGTDIQITSLNQESFDILPENYSNQNPHQNQGPEKESEATSSVSSIPHREDIV